MKIWKQRGISAIAALGLALGLSAPLALVACEDEDGFSVKETGEEIGDDIDEAAEELADEVDDAT